MKYFALPYKLRGKKRYLIWISNDKTSIATDRGRFLLSFGSLSDLRQYAKLSQYTLETEKSRTHDLGWVATWAKQPTQPIKCNPALDAWNLFDDVAESVPAPAFRAKSAQSTPTYKKLFWGSNLPSMTPPGRRFVPKWSEKEIHSLADVLGTGLGLFASVIRNLPPGDVGLARRI